MSLSDFSNWCSRHRKPLIVGALMIVAYIGAISRDQVLPWALGALLLSTLLLGVLWPYWLLTRLAVTRTGPAYADEGEAITFNVEVRNDGWMPRFMIELLDRLPFLSSAQNRGSPEDPKTMLGILSYLPARKTSRFEVSVDCEKRGFYELGPIDMASSFPLGLSEAHRSHQEGVQSLTIYPDVFTILSLPLAGSPTQIHRGGYLLPEGSGSAEFSGLREYRRGDSPRHIHWASSARHNELIVKEYEPLASANICIALDQAPQSNCGRGKHATFEYAVRIAASIARLACQQSIQIRFIGGEIPTLHGANSGDAHYQQILNDLAVIDCSCLLPYAALLNETLSECQRGDTLFVFLSENEERSAETLRAIAALLSKGVHVFAIVFERLSFIAQSSFAMTNKYDSELVGVLQDMGARAMMISCRDDLVKRFNS